VQKYIITCCETDWNIKKDFYPNVIRHIRYDPSIPLTMSLMQSFMAIRQKNNDKLFIYSNLSDYSGILYFQNEDQPFLKVSLSFDPISKVWKCFTKFKIDLFSEFLDQPQHDHMNKDYAKEMIKSIPELVNFKLEVFDKMKFVSQSIMDDINYGDGKIIKDSIHKWLEEFANTHMCKYRNLSN
jgi:hypothetical protein